MKIIFSQAFLSDVTRKDTTLLLSRYFLGKTIIEKWFDNWDELTSDEFVLGFNSNQRTTERKIEGLWESNGRKLKIHIKIDEAEAYNINNSLMGYNIGFFYYKDAYGKEDLAWVLIPDDITLDQYTVGRFGFSEYTSLDLILGSNMIDVPTETIQGLEARLECEGITEETTFLEGHGVFRGVDPWSFPESTDKLIYSASVKDYIIGGKGTEFMGADVFLSPEGIIGENPVVVKIPEEINLKVSNSDSPDTDVFSVSGLGGTLYLGGTWNWKKYLVTSCRWEYISSGEDLTLETLPMGKIIISSEDIVGEVNWKKKKIEVLPYYFNNGTRQTNISIEVPKLSSDGSITYLSSTPVRVIQNTSTAAWEVDFPGISKTTSGFPLLELINGVEKSITARSNQDFEIVYEEGKEPKEGGWIRVDSPEEGIDPEALSFTLEKISHEDLWWELKITFLSNNYLPVDPLKYTLWMGNESYEFFVLPGDAMLLRTKIEVTPIPIPQKFLVSGSDILEIPELSIEEGVEEFQIYLQSTFSEDIEAIILPPETFLGDMVFASSLSHRIIIPAELPNLKSGVWIPVKILGSGEEIPEEEKWRIIVKPRGGTEEKSIEILRGRGKGSTYSLPIPPSKLTGALNFHSLGNCLEGSGKYNLGTVIGEIPKVKAPGLTYLLMWTKEEGYTQVEEFSCFDLGNVTQLLSRLSINLKREKRSGVLILREWGKEDYLWTSSFIQGYITGSIDPKEIQLSGPKNSILPVIVEMEVKGIEQEPISEGKKKDAREIITSPEIIDVEWLEGSEKLELEGRRIERRGDKYFPVFNVSSKFYNEEFKIHVRLKLEITLNQEYRELYKVKEDKIFLPIEIWINKPKL